MESQQQQQQQQVQQHPSQQPDLAVAAGNAPAEVPNDPG